MSDLMIGINVKKWFGFACSIYLHKRLTSLVKGQHSQYNTLKYFSFFTDFLEKAS